MLTIDNYPELKAKTSIASKLVVLLHGLGSDGDDLISLAPFFQAQFPSYHFISPHAVEPFDMAPFGRQWFSLSERSISKVSDLAKDNAPKIMEIIHKKQDQLNLTNQDTIIIGPAHCPGKHIG